MLIYPLHEIEVQVQIQVQHTGITIRETSIDLTRNLGELESECDRFANDVPDWTEE